MLLICSRRSSYEDSVALRIRQITLRARVEPGITFCSATGNVNRGVGRSVVRVVCYVGQPVERPFRPEIRIAECLRLLTLLLVVSNSEINRWPARWGTAEWRIFNVQAGHHGMSAVARHANATRAVVAAALLIVRLVVRRPS